MAAKSAAQTGKRRAAPREQRKVVPEAVLTAVSLAVR